MEAEISTKSTTDLFNASLIDFNSYVVDKSTIVYDEEEPADPVPMPRALRNVSRTTKLVNSNTDYKTGKQSVICRTVSKIANAPEDMAGNSNNNHLYLTEHCLIIKGLSELTDEVPKNRLMHDLSQIKSCFTYLLRDGENIEIRKAYRLGTYEQLKAPRPLKVILGSEAQRKILLERKSLLRNYGTAVFFQREYSPRERQKYSELYLTMKTRMEMGETSLIIRNGEIVKKNSSFLWSTPVTISCLPTRI
jgi:hypothetical protein